MTDTLPLTFTDVLRHCAADREFVAAFDRLRGTSLSRLAGRSGLDAMIDDATGRTDAEVRLFVEAVYDLVWLRCPGLAGPHTREGKP